jgi:hypothetical protein
LRTDLMRRRSRGFDEKSRVRTNYRIKKEIGESENYSLEKRLKKSPYSKLSFELFSLRKLQTP